MDTVRFSVKSGFPPLDDLTHAPGSFYCNYADRPFAKRTIAVRSSSVDSTHPRGTLSTETDRNRFVCNPGYAYLLNNAIWVASLAPILGEPSPYKDSKPPSLV